VPAAQFWQLVDPVVDLKVPAAHEVHALAVVVLEYVPAPQFVHVVADDAPL